MNEHQRSATQALVEQSRRKPHRQQLPAGDDPVLSLGESPDRCRRLPAGNARPCVRGIITFACRPFVVATAPQRINLAGYIAVNLMRYLSTGDPALVGHEGRIDRRGAPVTR